MDDRGGQLLSRSVRGARRRPAARALAFGAAIVVVGLLTGCSAAAPEPSALVGHTFTSTSGRDSSGEVAWIASTPLVLSFDASDGQLRIGLKTPCNSVSGPVVVTGDSIAVDQDQLAATMMGCLGPEGGYEQWATAFIREPLAYTLAGDGTLTLTAAEAAVVFARTT